MKISVVILLLLSAFIYTGCRSKRKTSQMDTTAEQTWVNPEIIPRNHPQIESIQRLGGEEMDETGGMEGLIAFCERMNHYFADSELTASQAIELYELLYASGILFNEAVGMPDPDEVRQQESVEDLQQRIALKKSGEDLFEIFYLKTSCGFTYFYGTFTIPLNPQQLSLTPKEVWRASVPC